ncbi:hypothetical protein PhCBS80983_g06334 [Powellomyces hirtus]|uniref:Protein kinase domain-containing protein n=1 Tax=Powellomyces hirtus TaxID=109895 RepID=A0A507DNK5_9FUNG|nr:hypothetical protein PhCBS80983_g06334 [Powellomyces hirtus]
MDVTLSVAASPNTASICLEVLLTSAPLEQQALFRPHGCQVSHRPDDGITVVAAFFSNDLKRVQGSHLKNWVFKELIDLLPAVYSLPGASPLALPLTVTYRTTLFASDEYFETPYNVPNGATLKEARERCIEPSADKTFVYLVDLTNNGVADINDMLGQRYPPCSTRTKTRSSTKAAIGCRPSRIFAWKSFAKEAAGCAQKARTPLHRTRYTPVPRVMKRAVGSETAVESIIDQEAFQVLNNIYHGTAIEASERFFILRGIIGQPDRAIHDCLKLLIPIEVRSSTVLSERVDLQAESLSVFEKLARFSTVRYNQLKEDEKSQWKEIVGGNIAASVLIQANGYACANRLKYSIITNQKAWWFLERPDDDVSALRIAGPFQSYDQGPTVVQCLNYIVSLALNKAECPSPSETPVSSPVVRKPGSRQGPSGAGGPSNRRGGSDSSRKQPSKGAAARQQRFLPYKSSPAGSRARRALYEPATLFLIPADAFGEMFTERDMLPSLKCYQTEHSTVREVTVFPDTLKTTTIALKIIDQNKVDTDIVAQLETELDAYNYLEDLQGSVIPKLFAYGCFEGGQFLCLGTELISGRAPSASDTRLLPEAKRAYKALHDAGVLHGDVASRNLVVTGNPSRPVVIIDFGLASDAITPEDAASEMAAVERLFA